MQLQIPYRTESKKKEEEDNKEEIIENAIKESQIENLDNDEKVTIQSIHNVPQEKEKDTNDFAKKSNTNAYFNKNKKVISTIIITIPITVDMKRNLIAITS